jgi:hypothetical protein
MTLSIMTLSITVMHAKCYIIIKIGALELIKFITANYFPKHTNIATTLKQKLFTKVIREPREEAKVWLYRETN